jgi:hypothetical protein
MKSQNNWVIETLFIEIHRIIHGKSRAWVCYLCEPEESIRIAYPPGKTLRQMEEIGLDELMKQYTPKQIDRMSAGQLTEQEAAAIRSTGIAENDTLKQVLVKAFAQRLYALMFHWINLFDGIANPKVVEATDMCATWPGIRISPLPEGNWDDLTLLTPFRLEDSLSNKLYNTWPLFNDLMSAEPYRRFKVENFDSDEVAIQTLFLEAYCEIEIQSRQLIKDLLAPEKIPIVYPPLEEPCEYSLKDEEQAAIRSMGMQDEFLCTTLQRIFADCCYETVARWLEVFNPIHDPLYLPEGRKWHGAKLSVHCWKNGDLYPDELNIMLDLAWREFDKIISSPPQRPF